MLTMGIVPGDSYVVPFGQYLIIPMKRTGHKPKRNYIGVSRYQALCAQGSLERSAALWEVECPMHPKGSNASQRFQCIPKVPTTSRTDSDPYKGLRSIFDIWVMTRYGICPPQSLQPGSKMETVESYTNKGPYL